MTVLDEIRGRREVTVEQMLMALDLVRTSDTGDRRRLLAIASRGLGDPRVVERWVELAAEESDDDLRADMIARLAALEPDQFPDLDAFVRLLVSAVAPERTRAVALGALDRLAQFAPLVDAFRVERNRDLQRLILVSLARHDDPPAGVIELFGTVIEGCDADVKPLLVDRLLRAGALGPDRLLPLLRPAEPPGVHRRVLDHIVDRSIDIDVSEVVARDPHPGCRIAAIEVLVGRGAGASTVVDALRRDPDERVRAAALRAFHDALALGPAIVDALLLALGEEKTTALSQVIIGILTPHLSRSPAVRAGLEHLSTQNLDEDVAVALWRALGPLVAWDDATRALFAAAFSGQHHDRVRGAILEALSAVADPDDALVALYRSALGAPDPRLREWGLRGLRLVSMDEAHVLDVAAGADSLIDDQIDGHIRLDLARKIAAIPHKSDQLVAALRQAGEQASGDLGTVCRTAADRARGAGDTVDIDWEGWYRRVDVDKDVKGVFPGVFLHYDTNPDAARRVLRAALAPDCSDGLYANRIDTGQILEFLVAKDAIDDDLSRYCVRWILGDENRSGNPNFYLAVLKANLDFPALKENLWAILDRRSGVDPILMRELLLLTHRDDDEVADLLRQRLLACAQPKGALPYLRFLAGNAPWGPAEAIIGDVPARLIDHDTQAVVDEAYGHLKREPPMVGGLAPGPGLADE